MVEWVLDLVFFWKHAKQTSLMLAFLLVQASKGKMMVNNNNKLNYPSSTLNHLVKNENNCDNTAINYKWGFLLFLASPHKNKLWVVLIQRSINIDLSAILRSFVLFFQGFYCVYRTNCFHTPERKFMV